MDTFLDNFGVVADWFRQFLYDISDVFLDRDWVYYEDHTTNVWFGIIYTVLFLAIIPFLTDLIFTFILSVRSRKLIIGHTYLLQRFGIYHLRDGSLKYGGVSAAREYRVYKPDSRSINTPRVFALSSSSTNKPILYSVNTVNNSDIKYHSLGYTSPQFKDVSSHGIRNTGLDNVSVSNKPFVSDVKYKNVNSTVNYSPVDSRNLSSNLTDSRMKNSAISDSRMKSVIDNRDISSRNINRNFLTKNNSVTFKDSPMFTQFLGKFKLLQRLSKRDSDSGDKDD